MRLTSTASARTAAFCSIVLLALPIVEYLLRVLPVKSQIIQATLPFQPDFSAAQTIENIVAYNATVVLSTEGTVYGGTLGGATMSCLQQSPNVFECPRPWSQLSDFYVYVRAGVNASEPANRIQIRLFLYPWPSSQGLGTILDIESRVHVKMQKSHTQQEAEHQAMLLFWRIDPPQFYHSSTKWIDRVAIRGFSSNERFTLFNASTFLSSPDAIDSENSAQAGYDSVGVRPSGLAWLHDFLSCSNVRLHLRKLTPAACPPELSLSVLTITPRVDSAVQDVFELLREGMLRGHILFRRPVRASSLTRIDRFARANPSAVRGARASCIPSPLQRPHQHAIAARASPVPPS
ncbi:hypothetical protein MKEN_01153100 [Mycena kentingensis (nom. inval.)]|nr:hypothetical protein MKEN_01153100 [Mycena kentingensis (nom. inval.)]